MVPRAESAHWLAASVALLIGLLLLAEVIVGSEVFRRRRWRAYLFPAVVVASSIGLWVVTVLSTFSTMHLVAHAVWAQAAMVAGAVELAVVRGKLRSPLWSLVPRSRSSCPASRSSCTSRTRGSTRARLSSITRSAGCSSIVALFPLGQALRPRQVIWRTGFALTFVLLAVLLFADRDVAPIFGRLGVGAP